MDTYCRPLCDIAVLVEVPRSWCVLLCVGTPMEPVLDHFGRIVHAFILEGDD